MTRLFIILLTVALAVAVVVAVTQSWQLYESRQSARPAKQCYAPDGVERFVFHDSASEIGIAMPGDQEPPNKNHPSWAIDQWGRRMARPVDQSVAQKPVVQSH